MSATLLERLQACRERARTRHAALPVSDTNGRLDTSLDYHQLRFWIQDVERIESGLAALEAKS